MRFPYIPLNSDRNFVRGIASSGCQVFIPVENCSDADLEIRKQELQLYLDSQEPYLPPKSFA